MKKRLVLFFIVLATSSILITKVDAKTLAGLKEELAKEKQELENNEQKQKLTESQMTDVNNNIKSIQNTITQNNEKIKELNNEIEQLNKDIELKKDEIKKIINFAQISDGDSAYLEYMFGAADFTDFIYRTAVSEQLSTYNDNLIKEYNQKINDNKKKTEELVKQKEELNKKQKELEEQYNNLGNNLADLVDIKVDLKDSIKMQEDLIKEYEKLGCNLNEEFSVCLSRLNTLPPDTKFWRPLQAGRISSRFGYRLLNNAGDNHEGLDIATPIGTPVYAIANGVVVATYAVGGTGNAVYVRHTVNGKKYTSIYMHLSRYNVKLGDIVTKDSIVGYSGCTGQCYGAHLHLGLLTGHAGVRGDNTASFSFWSSAFYANLIDPASVVNFPSGYKSFSDRTTYYK